MRKNYPKTLPNYPSKRKRSSLVACDICGKRVRSMGMGKHRHLAHPFALDVALPKRDDSDLSSNEKSKFDGDDVLVLMQGLGFPAGEVYPVRMIQSGRERLFAFDSEEKQKLFLTRTRSGVEQTNEGSDGKYWIVKSIRT